MGMAEHDVLRSKIKKQLLDTTVLESTRRAEERLDNFSEHGVGAPIAPLNARQKKKGIQRRE